MYYQSKAGTHHGCRLYLSDKLDWLKQFNPVSLLYNAINCNLVLQNASIILNTFR